MSLEHSPARNGAAAFSSKPDDLEAEIASVRLLSWPQVYDIIPIARSTAWRQEQVGKFPKRVTISPGRVGWPADELIELARSLRGESDQAA